MHFIEKNQYCICFFGLSIYSIVDVSFCLDCPLLEKLYNSESDPFFFPSFSFFCIFFFRCAGVSKDVSFVHLTFFTKLAMFHESRKATTRICDYCMFVRCLVSRLLTGSCFCRFIKRNIFLRVFTSQSRSLQCGKHLVLFSVLRACTVHTEFFALLSLSRTSLALLF